ncbi:MAG: tannase/feruloyl esterase family alpha/beta hydrolase [Pseudomonadota bacterium]|nr:tannase/feruloyl esterase family alpha/beta hydrolase [Pseudomonadota bacterium]
MKTPLNTGLLAGGLIAALALSAGQTLASAECATASIQAIAPEGTVIDSATPTAAPVPHCRIDGHIITTDPGPNRVNFRLQLPDKNWNKRYYFIGMGGSAGYVPSDSQIPAGNPLHGGFAVAGTDTGRQGHMLDWGFLTDPAKAEDHIHRAMHVTAVATQALTRAYYDSDTLYRYMSGCSGGGRMATESITRHPEDFDGVLLGAPGGRSNMTMAAFVYNAQQMNREPGAWLSPAKLAMLDKKVTAACDELDGAKDDIIADHRQCRFDFDTLKCTAGDGPECLTEPELKSVKAVAAGPIGPDGKPLKPGYPLSNISVWSGFLGAVPPPWSDEASAENMARSSAGYVIGSSMAKVLFGPDFNALEDLDFSNPEHIARWRARSREIGFGTPYSADLRGLQKAGGKVLMWNGVSDPCCIDTELEEYYLEAGEMVGGMDKLTEFATFYRVPGMAHCGGGTGPQDATDQFLNAMIDWVENGKKPGPIVAHRGADRAKLLFADPATGQVSGVMVPPPAGESRDFLLCPHPQVARFDASKASDPKAVYNAANWSCRMPG